MDSSKAVVKSVSVKINSNRFNKIKRHVGSKIPKLNLEKKEDGYSISFSIVLLLSGNVIKDMGRSRKRSSVILR